MLDLLGLSHLDDTDGSSLQRYTKNPDGSYLEDDMAIVQHMDRTYPHDNTTYAGEAPGRQLNYMVLKDNFKLMITKRAESALTDMLFDLENDPYEENNLLGEEADKADIQTIGVAEYLKVKLVEWMYDKDGEKGYYSTTKYFGSRPGKEMESPIKEVKKRRTWPEVDLWVSHSELIFRGKAAKVDDGFRRIEYVYVGRTTRGSLSIDSVEVVGRDADFFMVVVPDEAKSIGRDEHVKIAVQFHSESKSSLQDLVAVINIKGTFDDESTFGRVVKVRGTLPADSNLDESDSF